MMAKTKRPSRASQTLGASLMLAPSVMAMRTPLLAAEAMAVNPWRVETVRAVSEKLAAATEGAVAAQTSLMLASWSFWPELLSGKVPSLVSGAALERASNAALRPTGRTVKANHRRLTR